MSAALNFGASSPIDIQITGGTPGAEVRGRRRRSSKRVADVPGAADVRVLQRNDAPYLVLEVNREKAAGSRPVGPRRGHAGRHRDELQSSP